ncbi:thioesterase superfamily protein [Pseudohyphozyma bogoriensis]|nr:thioesterase superfamily protein [Pseudohyphozyma bogoriensis]
MSDSPDIILPFGTPEPDKLLAMRRAAREYALKLGFAEESFVEIPVQWGDQDMNGHANNCVYFKYLETGRVYYMDKIMSKLSASHEVGRGKKIGFILASLSNTYLKPVFARDLVLVAHRIKSVTDKRVFFDTMIYSYNQLAQVGKGDAVMAPYDYKVLKAAVLPPEAKKELEQMITTVAKL